MSGGEALAEAALGYLGTPFRLHGRGRMEGVDCVGLLGCALADAGRPVALPQGYGLRNIHADRHLAYLPLARFAEVGPECRIHPGDVLVVVPGPAQHHLLIAIDTESFVHAHAGLRRVAMCHAPLPWPARQHWRLAHASKG